MTTLYSELYRLYPVPVMDIQWFASPEDEGRTEEPTERKIRKEREEGKVAKTAELSSALILIFGISIIGIMAKYMTSNLLDMMSYFFSVSTSVDISSTSVITPLFFTYLFKIISIIMGVVFIVAFMANVLQVGFLFTVKPIIPDFSRIKLDFGRFFKKTLFSGEAAFNLTKTVMKVIIVAVLLYLNIRANADKFLHLIDVPVREGFRFIAGITFSLILESGIALLILSFPDYMFQKKLHRESLKMSVWEIKEEMKQEEGDPNIKNRLRERMQQLLNSNMIQNVPKADVVITNPTHYAVALEYDGRRMNGPVVTAKGQDNVAQRIKAVAKENDVPIVENRYLARSIYAEVRIGDEIPEKHFQAVSIILREIYIMKGKKIETA